MSTWAPAQYERFKAERAQPFIDLLSLVQKTPSMRVVDLGCGTGELTALLHQALQAEQTLGIDSSSTMLEKSAPHVRPGLQFRQEDIAQFASHAPLDLVFSNAALHWLPDHPRLFEKLTAMLSPRGQLAVQMPANFDQPSHTVAVEVARESPFAEALAGKEHRSAVHAPEVYAALLHRLGYARQVVRLQVYGHVLASRDEVVEWVKGSLLTDYAARLGPELYARFEVRYREVLMSRLPDERPTFFPFKRLLIWGGR